MYIHKNVHVHQEDYACIVHEMLNPVMQLSLSSGSYPRAYSPRWQLDYENLDCLAIADKLESLSFSLSL